MNFVNNLYYFDITTKCGIGCSHCMYDQSHKDPRNLHLTKENRRGIKAILSDSKAYRISVSGEGEPLNNPDAFIEILNMSTTPHNFEFITSGFWGNQKLYNFLDRVSEATKKSGSKTNIRISTDSYHALRIRSKPQHRVMEYFLREKPDNMSLSFRGLCDEADFLADYFTQPLPESALQPEFEKVTDLEGKVTVNERTFPVLLKNRVKPEPGEVGQIISIDEYIKSLEDKKGRDFTLGNMSERGIGLDVTTKPNGQMLLYGLEIQPVGHLESLETHEEIVRAVRDNDLFRIFHTVPMKEILPVLRDDAETAEIIEITNNPYWIVKQINQRRPESLERVKHEFS